MSIYAGKLSGELAMGKKVGMDGIMIVYEKHICGRILIDQCNKCF